MSVGDEQVSEFLALMNTIAQEAELSRKALERIANSLEEGVAVDVIDIQQPAVNSIAAAVE